ncbi:hypothetical protein F5148DRAFT_589966 [Russula earlei]|uniref:Uncharacterized protein n=1 Tax=Russula earlei TaxID=71964 RepID=A0ACC0TV73_9AGAM|nr:hypothetical protein F5148DRAFT_589966 [Russula earlei]
MSWIMLYLSIALAGLHCTATRCSFSRLDSRHTRLGLFQMCIGAATYFQHNEFADEKLTMWGCPVKHNLPRVPCSSASGKSYRRVTGARQLEIYATEHFLQVAKVLYIHARANEERDEMKTKMGNRSEDTYGTIIKGGRSDQ